MTTIYTKVNIVYTVTDEKIPSDHAISRDVHGSLWQFDDVEGTKG